MIVSTTAVQDAVGNTPDDIGVSWLPPYHDMGLFGGIFLPMIVGGSVTLMAPLAFLQRPARWVEAISRIGATICGGPNFGYDMSVEAVRAGGPRTTGPLALARRLERRRAGPCRQPRAVRRGIRAGRLQALVVPADVRPRRGAARRGEPARQRRHRHGRSTPTRSPATRSCRPRTGAGRTLRRERPRREGPRPADRRPRHRDAGEGRRGRRDLGLGRHRRERLLAAPHRFEADAARDASGRAGQVHAHRRPRVPRRRRAVRHRPAQGDADHPRPELLPDRPRADGRGEPSRRSAAAAWPPSRSR